ncbi:MAG: hypothetical protein K8I30_18180 [Anaerolineae bacterium]|nr:hypothetical protein [Anaerolineae bacterium]
MEPIIRDLPSVVHPILILPLLRLVLVVTTGLGMAAISAKGLAEYVMVSPVNPFAPFAEFLPGRSAIALRDSPFACYNAYPYLGDSQKHCYFHPADGAFFSIDLTVDTTFIVQTTFMLRDNSVKVGDFRGWWDIQPFHGFPNVAFGYLPDTVVIARTTGHSDYSFLFKRVWSVTFTVRDVTVF